MSNIRMGGEIVFSCDECDAELETGEEDFIDAVRKKKEEGWKSRKDDTEWLDICPDCSR